MNNAPLQSVAAVAFTVSELAAIAQAVSTLTGLLGKIQAAAPNVWAQVTGDYTDAVQQWDQALLAQQAASARISQADAAAVVSASGVTPTTPTELAHAAEPAGPTTAVDTTVAPPAILPDNPTATVTPPSAGADAMGVGVHVQATTPAK